ncbi:MAG: ribonuclease H-like YkuK family protein [Patescibacteria group bacterium]|nr:ribonuclease H-like YkuK family protein [Patescibacteria group bacterium]
MIETFSNSFGMQLPISKIIEEIKSFMKEDRERQYKIIVGTDSERTPQNSADFVTALVVYRVGNGGRYFWRRQKIGNIYNLHDRIIREVLISLDAAKKLLTELQKNKISNYDFEIHADVGEKGETKKLIQEVVGIIRANNFEVKTKPESYAASNVADRHV